MSGWDWLAEHLSGPIGGMLSIAYGLGAATGWKFSERTTVNMLKSRIEELKQEVIDHRGRIYELEDLLLGKRRR